MIKTEIEYCKGGPNKNFNEDCPTCHYKASLEKEPRCARCGRTTNESEQRSLGLTRYGWLCDGSCRAEYESDEWPLQEEWNYE